MRGLIRNKIKVIVGIVVSGYILYKSYPMVERLYKENKENIKIVLEKFNKSSFEDFFSNYSDYIAGLNIAQNICFINIILGLMRINTLTSIATAIAGDKLIEHFQLEIKYPKLSN